MNFLARIFRTYTAIIDRIYYPRTHYIGKENLPADGNPIVLVSNHQNGMVDPINIEVALHDRMSYCLVRGDIFSINKWLSKILHWIGLLPVTRMRDIHGSVSQIKSKNKSTFGETTKRLLEGRTLIVFPEAQSQDKRWLGFLSLGYLNMAFEAAEQSDFSKEIYIMPCAHHYENYFRPFTSFLLRFGTPIPLSSYYELYKTKPRTAMRQINEIVERQISEMMLNIRDLDHYVAIDSLRESSCGIAYAQHCNLRPTYLPEKLQADQKFVAALASAKETNTERMSALLDSIQDIETRIAENKLDDSVVEAQPTVGCFIGRCLLLLVMFPLYVLSLIPTWLVFLIPFLCSKRDIDGQYDPMFKSTWNIGTAILITVPLCWLTPTIVMLCTHSFLKACIFFVAFPLLCKIVDLYHSFVARTRRCYLYIKAHAQELTEKRNNIIKEINTLLYGY